MFCPDPLSLPGTNRMAASSPTLSWLTSYLWEGASLVVAGGPCHTCWDVLKLQAPSRAAFGMVLYFLHLSDMSLPSCATNSQLLCPRLLSPQRIAIRGSL